ncbi:nuclear transport factor 2 family protein [Acidisoma sp. L85]|uniref:nuclear transport factor 2 family protein n=1 Tax=Acidisoma sp. L85 TaxID=1641850 RepID=UPI001C20916B|nr:nuclear transport factor 2 family protein [Acidisoma sp. L85]
MEENKKVALAVLKGAFIDRDLSVVGRLFAPDYVQHNPTLPNGPPPLAAMFASFPVDFKYEPGMTVADGDLVMVHGRYTGWGPKPLIAVDIFRVTGGKVVEHWDVMQEEVPTSETVSGNPMFVAS